MELTNIVPTGDKEYWVKTLQDLVSLSFYAQIGTKAYCAENEKLYILINVNEWVSI